MSLHRDPERPLHKAVGMEPDFTGDPKMLGDARLVGYLPMRAANREWDQLKRGTCALLLSTKLKGVQDLMSERFDIRRGDAKS